MKFAKIVFLIAGIFGVLACIGLYFTPGTFVYYGLIAGLISGVVAWQVAFFMIAWDPQRFRPIMTPAVIEKMLWVASHAIPHGLLGVLFIISYFKV